MMADKYGGGTSLGGVRVQKLTPEGEKLLKENKLSTIVNAQKFIKFKTKDGKTKIVPSNKYIVEGIGSRDAPLVPKGATPKTPADKKAAQGSPTTAPTATATASAPTATTAAKPKEGSTNEKK